MKVLNKEDLLVRANGLAYKKYAKGPFTGTAVSFHNNGQLKTKESYKYGRLVGNYEEYFKNGKLKKRGIYSLWQEPDFISSWLDVYLSVHEEPENGYFVYITIYGDGDHSQYEVFKDGKPLDSFAVERQASQFAVGRYKGHWNDAPVPEFICDWEPRYCNIRKKDALTKIREGVWEWFSALGSSFDSNQHGSEIWHELSCTAWLFRKVHIKNSIRNEESNYNVYNRLFFKDDHMYRSEYFEDSGGREVTHYNKDGSSLIEEFDADGNLIESRVHTDSISDMDDDIPF